MLWVQRKIRTRLDLLSIPQSGYCGCSKIFRQNIPHEVYVHIGCATLLYLFEYLCMVPTILQNKEDACYCEFYRAVNFGVRDTATIRNQNGRAIRLGTQEACSRLQLLAPSKKYSLFKEKGLSLLLSAHAVNTAYISLCIVLSLTQELTTRVLIFL